MVCCARVAVRRLSDRRRVVGSSLLHAVFLCTVTLIPQARLTAQAPPTSAPAAPVHAVTGRTELEEAITRSDVLFTSGHPNAGLDPLTPLLAQEPPDERVLWRAARAHVAFGILSPTRETADAQYLRAVAEARRAVQANPASTEARYWLAVATGRRALRGDFRRILPLAVETYAEAQRLLARDSLHAGAHDIVGKLYSEVRKLPWIVRKLAATVTRQDVLRLASWQAAEFHLRRAIALDSTVVVYRADLTQLYLRMDRLAEARAALSALERLPNRTPADTLFKREAREWVTARGRMAR